MKKLLIKLNLKRVAFCIFAIVAVILIIFKTPTAIDGEAILSFNRDLQNYNVKLQVIDQKNKTIAEFFVAIADNDNKKMYGLMNLDSLPKDYGMLFPFFESHIVTMWMKNTRIPLDMIFIDNHNIIVSIKTHATPYSLDIISSEKEAAKALEVNAGSVDKLKIKVGQKIRIL